MADTAEPPFPSEDEESLVNFPTLFLALMTLAVYIFFLKPTAAENNNNTNANANAATNNRTSPRQRQRGGRRAAPQQQQQQQTQQQQQHAQRRRRQVSENALEVLEKCKSLPPHVVATTAISTTIQNKRSSASTSIGGFEILSENGLVVFSHTKAAAASKTETVSTPTKANTQTQTQTEQQQQDDPKVASLLQRKERAKILSRLFAATHKNVSDSKALPAPPSKGSIFVMGVSKQKHLADADQRSSLIKVIRGLATHYTVLVVVSLDGTNNNNTNTSSSSSSYEPTHMLHSEVVGLLRNNNDSNMDDRISESVLPSHRVLLAGSARGKVALVRQLSKNIGLTIDFEEDVKVELERFGYDVSIVEDWKTILPA